MNERNDTSPETKINVAIFTYSISGLQALMNEQDTSKETSKLALNLNKHQVDVVLQWIPGHSGIKRNEQADTLAKQRANLPLRDVPVSYDTAVQMIKSNLIKND